MAVLAVVGMLGWGAYTSYFDRHHPAEWMAYTAALVLVVA